MPAAIKTRKNGKKADDKPATRRRSERRDDDSPRQPQPKGRSIWKGAISFGMVTIPVAMYPATRSLDISFNLIHSVCNNRIHQKRWCPVCDREVPMDELVKGYQYAKNQYVIMTPEDFQRVERPSSHTLSLMAFSPADQIDPVYYEKSYYLEPEPMGKKAFALLMRILEEENRVGLAMIGMRDRERLCAVRPSNGTLIVETLYYPDEVRVEQAEDVSAVEVSKEELDMARMLVEMRAEPFDPSKYEDTYRGALMEAIEAKMHGEPITSAPSPKPEKMLDLVSALKASLEKAGGAKPAGAARRDGRRSKAAA